MLTATVDVRTSIGTSFIGAAASDVGTINQPDGTSQITYGRESAVLLRCDMAAGHTEHAAMMTG